MDENIFKNDQDYWMVADNIKKLYLSEGSLATLLDFERVLDELDLYAFKNWDLGELIAGPEVGRYKVSCVFLWPENLMPDPRGGLRLTPFDCDVKFKKTTMKVPVKIRTPQDYKPGTHKARLTEKTVWLVEIIMPKHLMNDIRTGSIELEDQSIDMGELDQAYDQDLDLDQYRSDDASGEPGAPAPEGGEDAAETAPTTI